MKLSVIVPSLTGQVPESLRRQVEGRDDVELVVVTGVSPVGRARNAGLDRARGEYVAWVDSDDEVADGWLGEILAAIADGVDVIVFDAVRTGNGDVTNIEWGISQECVSISRLVRDVCRERGRHGYLFLSVTRRSSWDGLRFDGTVHVGEDCLLLPHVLLRASVCRYLPKELYRYVYNGKSLTQSDNADRDLEFLCVWLRRIVEMPREYRGSCVWGLATLGYWICDVGVASGKVQGRFLRQYRAAVAKYFIVFMREVIFQREIPFLERMTWFLRVASAMTGCWFVQKFRARRHGR